VGEDSTVETSLWAVYSSLSFFLQLDSALAIGDGMNQILTEWRCQFDEQWHPISGQP
jgi:hypothetical protein